MVEVRIDEMTITLSPTDELLNSPNHRWIDIASIILNEAEDRLCLTAIFGERQQSSKGISGYSVGFKYGDHQFLFMLCFHPKYAKMGVLLKFSAQALDFYQEQTNLFVYEILQNLVSENYKVRCSRIDIAIDFINEGINITDIYNDYLNQKLIINAIRERNGECEFVTKKYEAKGLFTEKECETVYFGKRDSPAMLRIYNKKKEQIDKKGTRLSEALECEDWVRFEAEAKHDYAHKLTEKLLLIKDDTEYKELILGFFIQKFYFMTLEDDKYTESKFMKNIIEMKNDERITLIRTNNSRNMDLIINILHLFRTSGTISTLYKIMSIWGFGAFEDFEKNITEYVNKNYLPNEDCIIFLKQFGYEYKSLYPDFNTFFNKEIKPELEDESSS